MPKAAETALWRAFLLQKLLLKINKLDFGHPKWPRKIVINQRVAILNGRFGHLKCLFGWFGRSRAQTSALSNLLF
jgi:hypothetical protein